jgi:hypothetical protein
MAGGHKPTPGQKRAAIVSAVVLAATAAAIYLTVMVKYFL